MNLEKLRQLILKRSAWAQQNDLRLCAVYLGKDYCEEVNKSIDADLTMRTTDYSGRFNPRKAEFVICGVDVFKVDTEQHLDFRYDGTASMFSTALNSTRARTPTCTEIEFKDVKFSNMYAYGGAVMSVLRYEPQKSGSGYWKGNIGSR